MNIPVSNVEQVLDHLRDGVYFTDRRRVITYWNRAAERITGYVADEVVGRSCADNILEHVDKNGVNLCAHGCPLLATIRDGDPREAEIYLHHKDGHRVPVQVRVTQLLDHQGAVVGGIELFSDLSNEEARQLRMRELERLAMLDNLTELPNRNYIDAELEAREAELRTLSVPFGLLFIDIDHFKQFNDTHGHEVGDRVLRFVARTLAANARPFDVYGRWGGEEFVGIIRNVQRENLEAIAERTRRLVERSFLQVDGQRLNVTISIGAALAKPGESSDDVVKRSDDLLYRSKRMGRNRCTVD